ncbi:AraC family transcriptional regulator [Enterococcus florum]|uniref:AraC family transcriptional regulator n=1 Tax=Enterococcus florum TaxID=2480627 RepID=A0A4P5P8D2_9ENTE|nr:helix-turn-helix domain-containing protein [Enterococcus florum]GCF92198.1 AraC family transcriptional regulator [Enterococcus florum]
MKVLEAKNRIIDAKPFQLFTHDGRVSNYQEDLVIWSKEHLKTEALIYQFEVQETIEAEYLPDACVNLLFEIRSTGVIGKFLGISTKARKIVIEPGVLYFGIKPYTNVGLRCIEQNQSNFVDQVVALSDQFSNTEAFLDELAYTLTFQERRELLKRHRAVFLDETQRSVLAEYLSVLLCTETTALSMEKIERETGYSKRYTQRVFQKKIGVSPKLYSRIIRFQNAIKAVYFDDHSTLAKVACQLGYYDQAHLIHEFQLFTQTSPTKLLQTIQTKKVVV